MSSRSTNRPTTSTSSRSEALNYALSLYRNTIIFVSHDREFISSLATRIIEIADGKITDFPGTLAEFEDFKKRRAAPRAERTDKAADRNPIMVCPLSPSETLPRDGASGRVILPAPA